MSLIVLLLIAGCSSRKQAKITSLSPESVSSVVGVSPTKNKDVAWIVTLPMGVPYDGLDEAPVDVDTSVLRNPGVQVLMFHAPKDGLDRAEAQKWIAEFAAQRGGKLLDSLQVPVRTGPDGVTPMAMKNPFEVEPKPTGVPITVRIALSFPSKEKALEALKYIDTDGYAATYAKLQDGRPGVYVATVIPASAAADEFKVFEPIAKKLGGKVEFVGSGQ